MSKRVRLLAAAMIGVLTLMAVGMSSAQGNGPVPHVIKLDAGGKDYLPLLSGPPETVTMHSGLVTLAPGKSVGKHSTKNNEEMLIILEGKGEYRVEGGPILKAQAGEALYCPPHREHDMVNTGKGILRYIYIVAKAEGK